MNHRAHPTDVLFDNEKSFPILPAVEHYAGSEKLMNKALALQAKLGPIFDITFDCEDGAHAGAEAEHARMAAELIMSEANHFDRVGARIHDPTHPHWKQDLDLLIGIAGERLAFITLPKARSSADVRLQLKAMRRAEAQHGINRQIPAHVLIETHGALREVWEISALDGVESIDFGIMDFVSSHHGALSGEEMVSPGQFTHPILTRAKCEIVAAALANGIVPTHNVTTELNDLAHIREDARRARQEFGFLRMWSIHPNQIGEIVSQMQPDFSETEDAAAILLAAQAADWGPIQHRGKLHDRASYRYYWELLLRARATGVNLSPETVAHFFS